MLTPRRGLLLVDGRKVFGDTAGDVDESKVHVFFLSVSRWVIITIHIILTSKSKDYGRENP